MKTRNPFTKVVLTAAIIIFLGAASPQKAFADDEGKESKSPVGSWFVEITPGPGGPPLILNLATLNRPGTIIAADPFFGAGHGAWERTGKKDFAIRFLTLIPPDNLFGFPADSILTVTASLTVGKSGDVAEGTTVGTITDSAGSVIGVTEGGVRFTRIEVDTPGEDD